MRHTGAEIEPREQSDWYWIRVGTNPVYCAIIDGRVDAVAYETGEELGTDEADEPIVTSPGWFWFPADGSESHNALIFAPPEPGALRGSLDPVHNAALEAAAEAIDAYMGEGSEESRAA